MMGQDTIPVSKRTRKGSFYFYWGYNRSSYTSSDITFKGANYNFTLDNVKAHDKPYPFDAGVYFNPATFTIPQYNFRVGYFFSNAWSISIGTDHMKYVINEDQVTTITGSISETETPYNGTYDQDEIELSREFLLFEHTDGLNYVNTEVRRFDKLYEREKVSVNLVEGVGIGFMYPRTNCTLLQMERNDVFHFSGYGASIVAGLNITLFDHFFIQSELKGGYINMPNIRITNSTSDKGSQSFFFTQYNIVFGGVIYLSKK